uniref:Uncharacterized protein n=1 Tax=Rhizophora mucronata TaxID=61149 RepID=A0A2P2QSP2_RHIMU
MLALTSCSNRTFRSINHIKIYLFSEASLSPKHAQTDVHQPS